MTKKSVYDDTNGNNQRMNLNNGDNKKITFLQCMLGTSIVQNSQHALQHEQIMQLNYPRILFDSKYLLLFFAVILF